MQNTETKICQNCRQNFTIEAEDFDFYEKIKVPPPTFCPDCRLQRRLLWRNERTLYRRKCNAPGHTEDMISYIAPEKPYTVYDQRFWWSDDWNPLAYGKEYDFSKPFFAQFKELLVRTPHASLSSAYASMVNSDYSNWAGDLKNCYLVTDADFVQDSGYSSSIFQSRDCYDCNTVSDSELCYENVNCRKDYRVVYSVDSHECTDVSFSKYCRGSSHCFGCFGLGKKSYYIFNQPYSKEDYFKKVDELMDDWSRERIQAVRKRAEDHFMNYPNRAFHGLHNTNVSGDYIYNSKNVYRGFLVTDVENSKYVALIHSPGTRDCFDYTDWGDNAQLVYESIACGLGVSNIKFSNLVVLNSKDTQYSYFSYGCSNIFGCSDLRKKEYCILNKQYTRGEYESLIPKIIRHMDEMPYTDKKGRVYRYGEFFPPELSLFAYNESMAKEIFPLGKKETEEKGFVWRDDDLRDYKITMPVSAIPPSISKTDDSITKEIIACAHDGNCAHNCTKAFRVIAQEIQFYRKMGLPVPEICPNCRHYERLRWRNPMKLWQRNCDCGGAESKNGVYKNVAKHEHGGNECPIAFETSYNPKGPEIVYCVPCFTVETE